MTVIFPLGNVVAIDPIDAPRETPHGIIIPEPKYNTDPAIKGRAVGIGPRVQEVEVGDIILVEELYSKGQKIDLDGRKVVFIKEDYVLAIIEPRKNDCIHGNSC